MARGPRAGSGGRAAEADGRWRRVQRGRDMWLQGRETRARSAAAKRGLRAGSGRRPRALQRSREGARRTGTLRRPLRSRAGP